MDGKSEELTRAQEGFGPAAFSFPDSNVNLNIKTDTTLWLAEPGFIRVCVGGGEEGSLVH